jgi:hypothetical protein
MSNSLPVSIKQPMAASGGPEPVSLMELLTIAGALYTWSDTKLTAPSILDGLAPANFVPWIVKEPVFVQYKSIQTATFTISIQNLSGDTIRRDTAQIFNKQELNAALVYFRIWRLDAERSIFDFQGNVDDVEIEADGNSMDITGEGSFSWSKIQAPSVQIGPSCGNTFGSVECGSTAAVPCNNSYGTCSSIERFKGVVTEWAGASSNVSQYSQPAPLRLYNPKVAN